MPDVALFPIPGCVAFPGTDFPLHVFEPRYRAMVTHCLNTGVLMGVCHTQKTIREAKNDQSREEALRSNQATYKPFNILSAGTCELVKTFDDGRMAIVVHLEKRFRLIEEVQSLPFSVYRCEAFLDDAVGNEEMLEADLLRDKVIARLIALTNDIPGLKKELSKKSWRNKDANAFSFELFGLLRMPPDLLQSILEMRSPLLRLDALLRIINSAGINLS
ncbi:MAG: LON peptidase substrate-binding domain-containing protein [Pseudomonadales bacterium]|nr:LON peptidase substrate-binding domain-containing protein [Pseudomonadales bacterium]